jgi:hypothetical protein
MCLAPFTYLALGVEAIGWTAKLVVVDSLDYRKLMLLQRMQDGRRQLMSDVVQVGYVRLGILYQGLDSPSSLPGVQYSCGYARYIPALPVEEFDLVHEILGIGSRSIPLMLHGEEYRLMAFLLQQVSPFQVASVGAPPDIVELVYR